MLFPPSYSIYLDTGNKEVLMHTDGKFLHANGMDPLSELLYVTNRFPAFHERVADLYNQNEEFQGLCNDYFLCIKSLEQWKARIENDQNCLMEYKDLKVTLEQEICRFLEKSNTS